MLIKNVKSWYFQDIVVVMAGKNHMWPPPLEVALLWNNQETIHDGVYQEIIKLDLLTC